MRTGQNKQTSVDNYCMNAFLKTQLDKFSSRKSKENNKYVLNKCMHCFKQEKNKLDLQHKNTKKNLINRKMHFQTEENLNTFGQILI